MQPACNRVPKL